MDAWVAPLIQLLIFIHKWVKKSVKPFLILNCRSFIHGVWITNPEPREQSLGPFLLPPSPPVLHSASFLPFIWVYVVEHLWRSDTESVHTTPSRRTLSSVPCLSNLILQRLGLTPWPSFPFPQTTISPDLPYPCMRHTHAYRHHAHIYTITHMNTHARI